MGYSPGVVLSDPALQNELIQISRAISDIESRVVDQYNAAPAKPRDGQLVYADGTNWDPGDGEGFYAYYNATWNFLNNAAGGTDTDAIHDNVAAEISPLTEKVTPVSGDHILIEDSAAANVKKRLQVGNLPTGSGEANTGSNQGTDGVGVYDTKAGVDLQFRHVAPASSKVTTTLNGKDIDIDIVVANIDHDALSGFLGDEHIDWTLDQGATNIHANNIVGYSATGHTHSAFDRASSVLSGATVFSNIVVADGITTAIATRAMSINDLGGPYNNYSHPNHTGHVSSSGDGATALLVAAITGQTDIGANLLGTDEVIVNDGGAIRRADISRFNNYFNGILAFAPTVSPTFTGTITLSGPTAKTVDACLKNYTVEHQPSLPETTANNVNFDLDIGNSGELDLGDPDFTADVTLSMTNVPASEYAEFVLRIIQHSTTRDINWPASFRWAGGGTAPTLTTGDGSIDIAQGYTTDGGSNWWCAILQDVS